MNLTQSMSARLHQTPISAAVRRTPGVARIAATWWRRIQGRAFREAFATLQAPVYALEFATEKNYPDVPSPDDVARRDAQTIRSGNEFSWEMANYCRTSKFESLGYHDIYGRILAHLRRRSVVVLEIGIGIYDPTAPSGMHEGHAIGSSLQGWSNFFRDSDIHGADVDTRALVDTDQYRTHFVDQRSEASLKKLAHDVPTPLDLVVDDGLHTPEANAKTINALLPHLSPEGVLVVEDILPEFNFLWNDLPSRLRPEYSVTFYPADILRQHRAPGSESGMAVFTRTTHK